ncbi:ISL3 family transposase [Streptomyces sp. NPDC056361]|uniref:ISL3 family transposase n=1 Tax=Streptomyces sp. NPDC056361 TaxID=3345795 RepID=UPI0035E29F5C
MGGAQIADLLLPGVAVQVDQLVLTDAEARVAVRSRAKSAVCSGCGQRSSKVHCYYQRTLADRPVAGRRVRIELRARRLVCGNEDCARRTFAEQIPALTRRHARRTEALTANLTDVALFLGGRPGTRLFQRMAIDTCKDTLLRLIRALPLPSSGLVPHLGVDEFAVRRGRTYATILIDMTTRRPIDVLADRAAATFASWLRDHPEVRIICRDRAGSFRDGAQAGAPQARQVADAWHLLNNLAQAVERVIGRHRADLRQPLTTHDGRSNDAPAPEGHGRTELDIHGRPRPLVARTRERHQQIHERIARGDSLRAIARDLQLSRGTVNRFAHAEEVDELLIAAVNRPSLIDDYRIYLHHRWMEGCTNASALTREIQRLGYRGDVSTVRRHLKPYRAGAIPATAPSPYLTVRRVTDWIMRRPEHLTDVERKGLEELCERNRVLETTVEYARRLALMIRERRNEHLALDVWIADVRLDGQRELRTLANGMRRDRAAVQAALTTTYTSGAVEGNVTRIKLLKRQMYGRANFDLLRRRILLSP